MIGPVAPPIGDDRRRRGAELAGTAPPGATHVARRFCHTVGISIPIAKGLDDHMFTKGQITIQWENSQTGIEDKIATCEIAWQ
jgi:hypothetical protein